MIEKIKTQIEKYTGLLKVANTDAEKEYLQGKLEFWQNELTEEEERLKLIEEKEKADEERLAKEAEEKKKKEEEIARKKAEKPVKNKSSNKKPNKTPPKNISSFEFDIDSALENAKKKADLL